MSAYAAAVTPQFNPGGNEPMEKVNVRLRVEVIADDDDAADAFIKKMRALVGEYAPGEAPTVLVFEQGREAALIARTEETSND